MKFSYLTFLLVLAIAFMASAKLEPDKKTEKLDSFSAFENGEAMVVVFSFQYSQVADQGGGCFTPAPSPNDNLAFKSVTPERKNGHYTSAFRRDAGNHG